MNLADLSIRRPTFISCVVIAMIAVGLISMMRLGVDLFPDVNFPIVMVHTVYPGAGPAEIETLVSKPLEEELSTISGMKRIRSINQEGTSIVVSEFTLETDIKYAEQQIRDRVGSAKRKLPQDIKEPVIRRMDPSEQPVVIMALDADLPAGELYDVAENFVKPKIEQLARVGLVEIWGGRKREIQVELDRNKLKAHELSAMMVASKLGASGQNVPVGKVDENKRELVFRTLGEFNSLKDIQTSIVNFFGNDVPVTVDQVGKVVDGLEDERTRAYINGKKSLFFYVYRQSGSNTIAVVEAVRDRIQKLNTEMQQLKGKPNLTLTRDGATWIRANVTDVEDSIIIGIILTVIVVFFFLASGRSTIITGLALPNSLIGAFILMAAAGFTINIMTLLALSLSVGLLIDDAIVVRENIFRHIEMGKSPAQAAREGTAEVRLAVIATTLTVIAVFGPVAFLKGMVGQFFKQFGLTICFAMLISLFDALTIAPMLSAYFAGSSTHETARGPIGKVLSAFNRFQDYLERRYEKVLKFTLQRPKLVLGAAFGIFLASCSAVKFVPKTFLPPQDAGEFTVGLDLPPGTNLAMMDEVAQKVEKIIRSNKEVVLAATRVGRQEEPNVADIYVRLVPSKERSVSTSQFKDILRAQLKPFAHANPKVKDYDPMGGGMRPFTLNIVGADIDQLEKYTTQIYQRLKNYPGLKDVDINFKPGKPELQISPNKIRAQQLGVSPILMGQELRTQIEGDTPVKFREKGLEYDIRIRLSPEQRNLREYYGQTFVPNINQTLIRLSDVASPKEVQGPNKITRSDRSRYIDINADITPGAGLAQIMSDVTDLVTKEVKIPEGMRYAFIGQAENFKELGESMITAVILAVLFIFLILASLYESFITPLTIMLALPLAICGSFFALFVTRESLNLFSAIGCIMLLGVATKNSILLVDYANQLISQGMDRTTALIKAGTTRLRPILMTTMALIAGTLPIALGLNEASKQRTSMGVAIIGGLISSTVLTLVVVPAAFPFIDRFRLWSQGVMKRIFAPKEKKAAHPPTEKLAH